MQNNTCILYPFSTKMSHPRSWGAKHLSTAGPQVCPDLAQRVPSKGGWAFCWNLLKWVWEGKPQTCHFSISNVGETFEFPDRLVMFDLIGFAPKHDLSFYVGERGYFIRIYVSQLQCPHRDFKIFSCFVNRAKSWKNDQTNQATFSSKIPKFLIGWHQPW